MNKNTKKLLTIILSALIIIVFLFIHNSRANSPTLKVWFLNIGQGDSIFIKTPEGKDILIDGGPGKKVLEQLGKILPFWDRHIDVVILTHPHADHVNGLVEVLKRYSIGQVFDSSQNTFTLNHLAFEEEIKNQGRKKSKAYSDMKLNIENGIELKFLWPERGLDFNTIEDINNTSIVSKLSYGDVDFLFTGDAEKEVEKELLDEEIDIEFLKVGHHGSSSSSTIEFLNQTTPLVSIISTGEDNPYGHPHKETLENLSSIGSRILRTDIAGNIKIEVEKDGKWEIWCEKGCN